MPPYVTGAAGIVGYTLVDRLLQEGHRVTGVDNLSDGYPAATLQSEHPHEGPCPFNFVAVSVRQPNLSDIVAESTQRSRPPGERSVTELTPATPSQCPPAVTGGRETAPDSGQPGAHQHQGHVRLVEATATRDHEQANQVGS
jgi:NAD(P)-dependent dehydrogenase (short-subunit alcohol dehydrogenase family)